jgi:hypothetical protein
MILYDMTGILAQETQLLHGESAQRMEWDGMDRKREILLFRSKCWI